MRWILAAILVAFLLGGIYLYQRMKQLETAGKPRLVPLTASAR
jgi:hypothetical protein